MKVYVLKSRVIKMFPYLPEYEHKKALGRLLNISTIKESDDSYSMTISDDALKLQVFNGVQWYESVNKDFGVFKQDDGRWRLIFQQRR